MRRLIGVFMVVMMAFGVMAAPVMGEVNAVTPSTNETNEANEWAYFEVFDASIPGQVTLNFVSTRNFASCFEFRSDGDTSQMIDSANPNLDIQDGEYPSECVANSTETVTLYADSYVEVRMVFGAEGDERFDWTYVEVLSKDDCVNGGYEALGFSNQGQCVRFIETGNDSR